MLLLVLVLLLPMLLFVGEASEAMYSRATGAAEHLASTLPNDPFTNDDARSIALENKFSSDSAWTTVASELLLATEDNTVQHQ